MSKTNSGPGEAYKMDNLAKIVNGLKFILRHIWWALRVYLFENSKNYLFLPFQSLGLWPIGSRGITGFLQLLGSLESLIFHLFLVSQVILKVAADEHFACILKRMRLISFVYIAIPKIFRIILSPLFVSQEIVLLALFSWKLWDFRKLLTK